jgi:RNA polymerase sigma factor (sigma-70 family)
MDEAGNTGMSQIVRLAVRETPGGRERHRHESDPIPLTGEDQLLFTLAYREHYRALHAFLRRRVDTDVEASDIAQEAYLRVLRYRGQPDAGAVKALLYRIAVNLLGIRARVARAHHRSQHVPLDEELFLATDDPSQDRQAAAEQQVLRLMATVEKLPRKCRQVFVLSRFQGMSRTEVAQMLHMSIRTVDQHLTRALSICRKRLGSDWQ